MSPSDVRNYKIDHIKGVLIFLVVFAHLLELFEGDFRKGLYVWIYSFHMPVFVFCSGFFARPGIKRVLQRLVYPYAIYQVLYLLFGRYVLQQGGTLQFTKPYWLLWYLLSMIWWTLLLPVFSRWKRHSGWILAASVVMAVAAGYVPQAGYQLSISRTVVMLPFFLGGYYTGNGSLFQKKQGRAWGMGLTAGVLICSLGVLGCSRWIDVRWMYHSFAYVKGGYGPAFRLACMAVSMVWIAWLMAVMPRQRIGWLAGLGTYTMSVYLIHGFAVKWLDHIGFFSGGEVRAVGMALILAICLCGILGNRISARILAFTCSAGWFTR